VTVPDRPVSRADIEAKLRDIRGSVDTAAAAAKPSGVAVAVVAVVVVVAVAYLLGKRKGRKRSAVIEIRRA
jgi:hypothetical protein